MILHGNALEVLQTIEPESVHTCVTSPPYFGLRDYGLPETIWNEVDYLPLPGMGAIHIIEWKGCLGLEPTIEMFVGHIILIFREVHKILRKDGTVWVNFGDSYSGSGKGSAADPENAKKYKQGTSKGMLGAVKTLRKIETSCKPKDMMGIPWRVAFALQADGWYLRQDIIWNKPNPMPESVTDRCAKSHEYIFLMSKSRTYYFDSEAIKEPISTATAQRIGQDIENQKGSDRVPGKTNGNMKAVIAKGNRKSFRGGGSYTGGNSFNNSVLKENETHGNESNLLELRNKRDVWTITTQPYKEAHFATFPKELIRPCILAGCPVGGTALDPFFGSGTVGEVALEENRDFIGIELNPEYIELEKKRISNIQVKMII